MTPLPFLAVQFRSVLELFCANFVGAPICPLRSRSSSSHARS